MTIEALVLVADGDWGHMDGGGWWILMALGMILFWALVIAGIVWLVRELAGPRRHEQAAATDPVAVLDRRLAEGTISPEEYRERRAILTGIQPGSEGH